MAHGQGATSNRRGGYGPFDRGTRGHGTDKSVKKAIKRERDPRVAAAMEESRRAQEKLDALIKEQKENPADGAVAGAMYAAKRREAEKLAAEAEERAEQEWIKEEWNEIAPDLEPEPIKEQVKRFSVKSLPQEGDGNFPFAVTMAKKMLKQGYHIAYTLDFTGVGYEDVRDAAIDKDGWGIRPEEDEDEDGPT